MTNKRIKDLTGATPTGAEYLPFDSSGGGTKNETITNVVDVGNQTIDNPVIGVDTPTNATTIRTQLLVSGASVFAAPIALLTGSDGSGNPYAALYGQTIQNGSFLIDSEHQLTISASSCVVSGWGGRLYLAGGRGGVNHDGQGYGGDVQINGGGAGTHFSGSGNGAAPGGNIYLQAGAGANVSTPNVNAGGAGGISLYGGSSGGVTALSGTGDAQDAGSVQISGGNSGGSMASGSGGAGGPIYISGGGGGPSFAGRGGDGGGISITAGTAGQGSSAKTFHSGNTIGNGGAITLQAGGPTSAYSYKSGSAGAINIWGGTISSETKYLSGTIVQIGDESTGVDSTQGHWVSRIMINVGTTTSSLRFPGTDVFFYVSGSRDGKGSISGSVAGFGGDIVVSGALYSLSRSWVGSPQTTYPQDTVMHISGAVNRVPFSSLQRNFVINTDTIISGTVVFRSSSNNPVNFLINGNTDGGIAFSGSLTAIASPGGVEIGNVTNGSVIPLTNRDTYFFVSGNIGGKDSSTRGIADFGGDVHISGNLYTDGSNNPLCKVTSSVIYTVVTGDFGNGVALTHSSSLTASFTNNLTASFPSGRFAIVVIQVENTGALGLISMSGGATMNGSTATVTLPTGSGVYSFTSRNGLNWYR